MIDRQGAAGDGGGAGVGVRPSERERARPSLDEIAAATYGSTESSAGAVAPSRQREVANIDVTAAVDRADGAVDTQLNHSTSTDSQRAIARQAAGDQQRAPSHCGDALVSAGTTEGQLACSCLRERSTPAYRSAERGAAPIPTCRQREVANIDVTAAGDRADGAVDTQLHHSTRTDGQGAIARQAAGDQQHAPGHCCDALVGAGTTEDQLTLSRLGERARAGHAPREGDREARIYLPGAPDRSQQKRAIARGVDCVRNLGTQHTSINNKCAISLRSTPKEANSGVCQGATINGQNWSQLVVSVEEDRAGITLAQAAISSRTLRI